MTETNDAGELITPGMLPAPDCNVLSGIRQIAAWRGLTVGQTREAIRRAEIVVFKRPGRTTIFALKSQQNQFWQQEASRNHVAQLIRRHQQSKENGAGSDLT